MYFDLMRLFNESYEVNPESGNVRFKTDFGFVLGKKMSNEQLIDTIISDLMQARDYLKRTLYIATRHTATAIWLTTARRG